MRVRKFIYLATVLGTAALALSCQALFGAKQSSDTKSLSPVVSFGSKSSSTGASSYQADVEVYRSNNRSVEPPALASKYRLAVKIIGGKLCSRVDLPASAFPDGKARAILSDGASLRYVDLDSMRTVARVSLKDDAVLGRIAGLGPSERTLSGYVGKADIAAVSAAYRSLSFDVAEENGAKGLAIGFPASALAALSRPGFRYTGAKLYYDVAESSYAGADSDLALEDGTTVHVATRPVYEDHDGVQVKVGEVTTSTYDSGATIDPSGASAPRVDDPAALPQLSDADLDALKASGATVIQSNPIVGDPYDPKYTVTDVSVYQNISVDSLDDASFAIGE
jgi:hypothetical protein